MSESPNPSRDALAAFLAQSDARCPSCRYALRGCTSDKCPECGASLTLEVGVGRDSSGWWLAGLIGLNISIATLLLLIIGLGTSVVTELQNPGLRPSVRAGFASSSELARWAIITPLAVLLVAQVVVMAGLASRRASFTRMPNPKRAWLGLLAAASPLMTLGIVAIIARS